MTIAPVLLASARDDMTCVEAQLRILRTQCAPRITIALRQDLVAGSAWSARRDALMRAVDWPCDLRVIAAPRPTRDRGFVEHAVDMALAETDRVIVMPDDVVPLPQYLRFASAALERFADEPRVGSIAGVSQQRGRRTWETSAFFSRLPLLKSFATWRRAWALRPEVSACPEADAAAVARDAAHVFGFDPFTIPEWTRRLFGILTRSDRSLETRMLWAHVRHGMLALLPATDLVEGSGTNELAETLRNFSWVADVAAAEVQEPFVWPAALAADDATDAYLARTVCGIDAPWPTPLDDEARRAEVQWLLSKSEYGAVIDLLSAARQRGQTTPVDDVMLAVTLLVCNRYEVARQLLAEAAQADPAGPGATLHRTLEASAPRPARRSA